MRLLLSCFAMALLVAASPVAAQTPRTAPQRPAAPPVTPPVTPPSGTTSVSFGDWVLRCEARPAEPAPGRGCELLQSLQDQRRQPVAQFAFGRARPGDPMRLLVLIPANITVAVPMRLTVGDTVTPITLRACGPRGCVADAEVSAATLARMRAREVQGRLEYRDALNGEVALPFSTRGLGQALEALAREGF